MRPSRYELRVDNGLPLGHLRARAKPALGRGLAALLGGSPPAAKTPPVPAQPAHAMTAAPVVDERERVERASLTRIRPCPLQPRKDFSEEALRELADSIKEQGIVQPLIVRARGEGYELILGLNRAEEQKLAAERIIKQSLNVRQTEELVAHWRNRGAAAAGAKSTSLSRSKESHVADLEHRLQERFGTRVDLRYRRGKGALQIHFYNDADLQRVLEIIGMRLD